MNRNTRFMNLVPVDDFGGGIARLGAQILASADPGRTVVAAREFSSLAVRRSEMRFLATGVQCGIQGLLQGAGSGSRGERGGDQAHLSQARAQVPPGRQQGAERRGEVQGSAGGLRSSARSEE